MLAAVLLILGFGSMVLFGAKDAGASVEVLVDGKIVKTMSLGKDGAFEIDNEYGHNTVSVKNGKVRVSDADCHGRDCVAMGEISGEGQIIVCLPHKLLVRISGEGDVDASV